MLPRQTVRGFIAEEDFMTPENYANHPLRPHVDSHGEAGVYLVQMQTDSLQVPFTSGVGPQQAVTSAGEIASEVWDTIHTLYANQYVEAAVLTTNGITALVRLFDASHNSDDEPEDGTFFADHAADCPCCAAMHAMLQDEDDPHASHVFYEFFGSAVEFVMEARSEIARAVWSHTGQRGTQFWSTIRLEPVADIPTVLAAHRAAMERIGIALPKSFALSEDDAPEDCSQN
jgi:hypothetical protein